MGHNIFCSSSTFGGILRLSARLWEFWSRDHFVVYRWASVNAACRGSRCKASLIRISGPLHPPAALPPDRLSDPSRLQTFWLSSRCFQLSSYVPLCIAALSRSQIRGLLNIQSEWERETALSGVMNNILASAPFQKQRIKVLFSRGLSSGGAENFPWGVGNSILH